MKISQHKILKLILLLVFTLILISGCASTGSMHTTMKPQAEISSYKTIIVYVTSNVPDSGQEIIQLQNMTVSKLRDIGLFEKVMAGSTSSDMPMDLELRSKIIKIKKGSSGSRILLGVLAGQAGIVVNAELIDLKDNKIIGKFSVEGKSSGGTIFAGNTSQAVERSAEQLALYVKNNL